MRPRIITLLTDFGLHDAYAGIMKGVILSISPGSDRGALLAESHPNEAGTKYLIAPDNGVLSLLARMSPHIRTFSLNIEPLKRIMKKPFSGTFHGRDIFAPAAALCTAGDYEKIRGAKIEPVVLPEVYPEVESDSSVLSGRVIHIDHFGNCVTSIHREDLKRLDLSSPEQDYRIKTSHLTLKGIRGCYSEVKPGLPLTYFGSSGFLEIGVREESAAARFRIAIGERVRLYPG